MEKTSEEYAGKMAADDKVIIFESIYTKGYLKAVEETNAKGLLEALVKVKKWIEKGKPFETQMKEIIEQEINKATK